MTVSLRKSLVVTVVALLSALALLSGCSTLLRAPSVGEEGAGIAEVDAFSMNKDLLNSTKYRSLVIEIDWLEGCKPRRKAIDALRECAIRWCDKPDGIEVVLDEEIPQSAIPKEGVTDASHNVLFARHANRIPREDTTYYIHVLYANWHGRGIRGTSSRIVPATLTDGRVMNSLSFIQIYRKRVDKHAFLLVRPPEIERLVLLHEFGHAMGLVSNPDHMTASNHCCNPACIMYSSVDARSVIVNFLPAFFLGKLPNDLCDGCKADLRRAAGN